MAFVVFLRGVNVGGHRTFRPTMLAQQLLRILATEKRFVFGQYRRHMKTIGFLGMIDGIFGVPVTTRNWNTILAIVEVLKDPSVISR
jgi:uncharacterized protein (DUF1697 family)